ncbi:MAG: beta-lactamase family protein [Kordiimonadaceae bacterium]|nr:beta-lactamase family protein [Kordiimonadaceae bacterium]MBO6567185.1 beta-lactamase family protein [Kordiimonadaceae bacterium]MBO6963600.1 beta-lactamase family protein [Kordiimonadaceae bacterium]
MIKRFAPWALFLVFGVSSTGTADHERKALIATLDAAARSEVMAATVTGITMAVGVGDDVFFARGFGVADIATGAPVTPATKMRAGSVSKVMTTALLAQLLAEDRLDLDANIQTYVPDFPNKRWPISLRQLAAHTSGIRHYRGNEFLSTKHYATVREGLTIFEQDALEFEPDTRTQYSSYAWNLVSAALEGAGEQDFLDQMEDRVFAPLGMTETQAEDVTKPIANISEFHAGNPARHAPDVDNSYKWAGGGFVMTARDMARFGLAHTDTRFLDAETLNMLFTEHTMKNGTGTGFGVGWMMAPQLAARAAREGLTAQAVTVEDDMIWHSGGSAGAAALLLVDPGEDIAVALMVNHYDGFSALLRLGLLAMQETRKTLH